MKPLLSKLASMAAGILVTSLPLQANALLINASFNASGTAGGNLSPAAQAVINSAISFYQSTFSDAITVNIDFQNMASGLGQSVFGIYGVQYQDYYNALTADASSANDATALANTAGGSANPVDGGSIIGVKPANGRAVGLNTPGALINGFGCNFTGDGCIQLNVANTTTGGGAYSLLATVEHEINEILGLGSGAGDNTPWTEDLFRFAGLGSYSGLATHTTCTGPDGQGPRSYFSIDGGATELNRFNNCDSFGDYGDWITHSPSQVQDATTNGSGNPFLSAASTEVIALDVVGYSLTTQDTVPEPATFWLLGAAGLGLAGARRRKARA